MTPARVLGSSGPSAARVTAGKPQPHVQFVREAQEGEKVTA